MGKKEYIVLAARFICVASVIFLVWLLFEYALGIILPFAIAFCVGVPLYFASQRISKRIKIPQKLCGAALVLIFLGVVGVLGFFGLRRLFMELSNLISSLGDEGSSVHAALDGAIGYVERLSSKIPLISKIEAIEGLDGIGERAEEGLKKLIEGFASRAAAVLSESTVGFLKATPRALVGFVVSLLSCFYFAMDYGTLRERFMKLLPESARARAESVAGKSTHAVKRYIRAYLLIMLLTFVEVLVGLLILGKPYAFIAALLVAVVDILPVFGAGAVLLPWAALSLLMRDMRTGLGLIILFAVMSIVRQIAEPKIVGDSLGIHPLVTLFAMFAGLSLFGVAGMLLGPAVALVLKELLVREGDEVG